MKKQVGAQSEIGLVQSKSFANLHRPGEAWGVSSTTKFSYDNDCTTAFFLPFLLPCPVSPGSSFSLKQSRCICSARLPRQTSPSPHFCLPTRRVVLQLRSFCLLFDILSHWQRRLSYAAPTSRFLLDNPPVPAWLLPYRHTSPSAPSRWHRRPSS